jgi:hypothetical protein
MPLLSHFHLAMLHLSHPDEIAKLILDAAKAVTTKK